MHDATSRKIIIACRFIQHDQWFTTHVDPQWTTRQLKIWLVHRLFDINIPAKTFTTPSQRQPQRPPSPITFAPDPRDRPPSPIIFAAPQSGLYGPDRAAANGVGRDRAATLHGILTDTDDDLLSGSESGFSSAGKRDRSGRKNEIRIETGLPSPGNITPGGRIGPSQARVNGTDSRIPMLPGYTVTSSTTSAVYTAPDADRFPGGINPYHWTLTRYSTGQIFGDDEQLSWYDLVEFELLELHGLSFPSTHPLYEYQVCHLWNQHRHRERQRLRKKLGKRFETEATRATRDAKGREKNKDGTGRPSVTATKRATLHAQILRAMDLNSGASTDVGVVEYYGSKLASVQVELTLTRIPRSIDTYIQPYWEGWVRILRIVWRGNLDDIANLPNGYFISLPPNSGSKSTSSGPMIESYQYGIGHTGTWENMYHKPIGASSASMAAIGDMDTESSGRTQRIIRLEWRERWVRIQNGTLAILKDREDEYTTYVLPLKSLRSIHNTQHLARYLSCTSFNPPQDHPSINRDILMPALNVPIPRPSLSTGYSSHSANPHSRTFKSKSSSSSTPYPDSEDSDSLHHYHYSRYRHHGSQQPSNFNFPSNQHLIAHVKARESTPLVGSRFDPSYLPITPEEQKASGLRVVCLQFHKHSSIGLSPHSSSSAAAAAGPSLLSHGYEPKDHDGGAAQHERGGERESGAHEEQTIFTENEPDVNPVALVLEDMKHRADEWGGIRSNNILWKCSSRLRSEPLYLIRARARIAKLRSLSFSGQQIAPSNAGGLLNSSIIPDATIRKLNDARYPIYGDILGHSSKTESGGRRSPNYKLNVHKERYYEREQRQHRLTDSGLPSLLTSQIFNSPASAEHFQELIEARKRREREKREKELLKKRAKQEKKEKGKGKGKEKGVIAGGRRKDDRDWNLGSLNVGFWNWKKKKRAKKEKERLRTQWDRQVEAGLAFSNNNSSVVSSIPASSGIPSSTVSHLHRNIHGQNLFASSATSVGTGNSANTVTGFSNPAASSTTVIGGGSHGIGVELEAHSIQDHDDDGHNESEQYHMSEPGGEIFTEEEEDEEEEDEDVDEEEDGDGLENNENVVESYPDATTEPRRLVETEVEEDRSELIGYASHHTTTSTQDPSHEDANYPGYTVCSHVYQGSNMENRAPNLVLQVKIDKHVQRNMSGRMERYTADFNDRSIVPSSSKVSLPVRSPSSPKRILIDTNVQRADSGMSTESKKTSKSQDQITTKRQNQRLIGQLHSSGEEEDPERESDGEESSSPVFASPPTRRRRPLHTKSPATNTVSSSSRVSCDSIDGGAATEDYDFDDDLESEDEFMGHTRRAGYWYGSYETKKDEDKKKVQQLEEEERRIKILREMEAKEKSEMEKERETRKKEEEGEWVCLDIGNDYGFQSFLRVVHRDCPHPIKSTFLDRMAGGPLLDIPTLPQNLPKPLIINANARATEENIQHGDKNTQTQSQTQDADSVVHKHAISSDSFPDSLATPSSDQQLSPRASTMSPVPQTSTSVLGSPAFPRLSSAPHGNPTSLEGSPSKANNEVDSKAEHMAPLPGYGDPRFVYPSRTFATPPYPEWRVNVMRKAQHAGMGDVGGAMEFINWGRDDPVITGANGAVSDFEKMGRLWGSKGKIRSKTEQSRRRDSDNVSGRETTRPRTTGSEGTVKDVQYTSKEPWKRLSLRNTGSVKGVGIEKGRETGNEGLTEADDVENMPIPNVDKTSKSPQFNAMTDMTDRSSDWSDEEEEYMSEMEWTAWHIDLPRQSKRQHAIEARRKVSGASEELQLDIPVSPADDMKRHLKKLFDLEPQAQVVDETTLSFSKPVSARSAGYSSTATSSLSRFTSKNLSPHRVDARHPILHHSASLHTGLRKGTQESPLRRPSMPILIQDKGKGKERSFWSFSAPSNEIKSPITVNSNWFSKKETREKEIASSILQPTTSTSGIVGRSGNLLLKGGLLRKKDSGDVNREKERNRVIEQNEKEFRNGPRPHLRVATSSSAVLSSNPRSALQVKSGTTMSAPGRFVRKMKSDANVLSIGANDFVPEVSSLRQGKKKQMGKS